MPPMDLDAVEDFPDENENDHESDDEDFNPTTVRADDSATSSDEENVTAARKPTITKGKRKAPADEELDSGDEVTIEAARKRKANRRKGANDDEEDELVLSDDEGGEGGLIKTRAQRRVEQKERKPLARTDGATVDVDALWARMSAAPLQSLQSTEVLRDATTVPDAAAGSPAVAALEEEEQVVITKVYTFAGQNTTEEKQVPRASLQKYLADGWKTADATKETPAPDSEAKDAQSQTHYPTIRRPLRRPSRYDPNPTGYVRALPPEAQLTWPRKSSVAAPTDQENTPAQEVAKTAKPEKAQKLNVVDKSRLDWTGFVNKEGIAEELDTHGKTKEAYLGRMEFLAGVEARKEAERLAAKTAAAS